MSKGRIVKALSGFYYVDTPSGQITCRARGKLRQEGQSPLVGDWVEVRETEPGYGMVWEILPRKNAFDRPSVANIDQLVIVASCAVPITEPFLIDRIAAIAALKGCDVLVCINKQDLADGKELSQIYSKAGIPNVLVSAETGEGLDGLVSLLVNRLSVFTGNSGVGKSSLLNAIDPGFVLPVAEISEKLGRGRHTTRHVELYRLSCGAELIDTPGFSAFDGTELGMDLKEHLAESFPEFRPYLGQCRYVGCSHSGEEGCAVGAAVLDGRIGASRYRSYLRLFEELKPLKSWSEKKNG